MARVPTTTTVGQTPAGTIPGQFAMRSEAPPGDFGAAAARATTGFGDALQGAGGVLAREAIATQTLQNETAATEATTAFSRALNEQWTAFSELQGAAATAEFPGFRDRVTALRDNTLASIQNPGVRRMLQGRVAQMTESMLAGAGQWNVRQTRVASVQASESAANQAIANGLQNRDNPVGLLRSMQEGLSEIRKIGEVAGWTAETLAQREAEYRGRYYSAVIDTLLNTDPVRAAEMYGRVRDQMDAASQVRLEDRIAGPLRARQAADIVARVTVPTGESVRDRVFRAENPAGDARRNPSSSASGPGQITDGTWRAYAPRLGLTDAQRNDRAAHEAIYDAYMLDAQRDIGRTLTPGEQYAAWVLGIAGAKAFIMAPRSADARQVYGTVAGESTADAAFRNNGNLMRPGMTVGQVLDALNGRVSSGPPRTDQSAMLQAAIREAGGDPLLQTAVIAQFNQWRTVLDATQAQERASMERRVQELGNALSLGGTASIPEADIRRLFQPAQADRILDELATQQVAGQVFQSVQLATPDELQTLRQDIRDGTGTVSGVLRARRGTRTNPDGSVMEEDRAGDIAARGAMARVLDERIQERNRLLHADPAQFVLADPAVREAARAAAAAPGDTEVLGRYVTATLAAQERLGVPEHERRVLAKATSEQVAAQLMRTDPAAGSAASPDSPALRLRALQQSYGEAWPRVFQDLQRDGRLPPDYQVLAVIPSAVGQADFARLMSAVRASGGIDKLRQTVPQASRQEIEREVHTLTEPFRVTTMAAGQSGGATLAQTVHGAVENLAIYYAIQGLSPSEAAQRAADRVLNDKYEFEGTMRVPRTLANGQPLGIDAVRPALARAIEELTPERLADIGGNPAVPLEERRGIAFRAAQRGMWVPNERDSGLVLMMELQNGGRLPVRLADGGRVEVFFDNLPRTVLPGAGQAFERRFGYNPAGTTQPTTTGERVTAPIAPPVQPVLPGEPRNRNSAQPRSGRWEPPQ